MPISVQARRLIEDSARRRPATWCRGCGYHYPAYGVHRPDCTLPLCGCGATLTRPESQAAGACLECRITGAAP
jgi:hypothetical protein